MPDGPGTLPKVGDRSPWMHSLRWKDSPSRGLGRDRPSPTSSASRELGWVVPLPPNQGRAHRPAGRDPPEAGRRTPRPGRHDRRLRRERHRGWRPGAPPGMEGPRTEGPRLEPSRGRSRCCSAATGTSASTSQGLDRARRDLGRHRERAAAPRPPRRQDGRCACAWTSPRSSTATASRRRRVAGRSGTVTRSSSSRRASG